MGDALYPIRPDKTDFMFYISLRVHYTEMLGKIAQSRVLHEPLLFIKYTMKDSENKACAILLHLCFFVRAYV